ncbi:MAG: hypothetical protein HY278_07140 [candidate division NC10 bacterium]|nr:hypothetical protein [candidate division NC10 bacterium]
MIPHYVLIIHGIGEEKAGFSEPLPKLIGKEFAAHVTRIWQRPPQDEINITEVVWADITEGDQDRLWDRLYKSLGSKTLSWRSWVTQPTTWIPRIRYWAIAREIVVKYIGDTIAYVETPGINKYKQIHDRVSSVIHNCAKDARTKGATARKPALLTIVAHSLGAVIASDLFYDVKNKGRSWPSEVRLANFITLGSPLALYVLRYGFEKPAATTTRDSFSSPITMDDDPDGLWINIFDSQDIIGYPLKPLNDAYKTAVFIDKEINAGQWWKIWQWPLQASPFSHVLYWEDDTVAEIIGRKAALDWLREDQPELGSRLRQEYAEYKSWIA